MEQSLTDYCQNKMLAVWTELSALSLMVPMMERRKRFSSWLTPPHGKDCQDLGWADSQMNCTDSAKSWRWFEAKRRWGLEGTGLSGKERPAVGIPDRNKWLIEQIWREVCEITVDQVLSRRRQSLTPHKLWFVSHVRNSSISLSRRLWTHMVNAQPVFVSLQKHCVLWNDLSPT